MQKPKIIDTHLQYDYSRFKVRNKTNMICFHHTGDAVDNDLSAQEINRIHQAPPRNWTAIGYHFVIRKDGTIEKGRPHWVVGAHAIPINANSIGIMLCGNFELAKPTVAQIEAAALLVNALTYDYGLDLEDPDVIVGHRDVDATACPGRYLYEILPTIHGKAKWYRAH